MLVGETTPEKYIKDTFKNNVFFLVLGGPLMRAAKVIENLNGLVRICARDSQVACFVLIGNDKYSGELFRLISNLRLNHVVLSDFSETPEDLVQEFAQVVLDYSKQEHPVFETLQFGSNRLDFVEKPPEKFHIHMYLDDCPYASLDLAKERRQQWTWTTTKMDLIPVDFRPK